MVVVGNLGRLRWACWAAIRAGKGDLRSCISGVTAAWRSLTAGLLVRAEVERAWAEAALASSSARTESGPEVMALAMMATSLAFSVAKENQSATSAGSFFSEARV